MGASEVFLRCQGCLSDDRRCNVINGNDLNVFLWILDPAGENRAECEFLNSLFLCWECGATLKKFQLFQLKIQKASNALDHLYLGNLKPQCLSTLKTCTKTKYDAEINTSLQFKEITVSKIELHGKPKLDDAFEIKDEFCDSKIKAELEVRIEEEKNLNESPENYDIYDNNDMNDSDSKSDDIPIKDLKVKKNIKPRSNKKNIYGDLSNRPRRLKKTVENFTKTDRKNKSCDVTSLEKSEQNKNHHSRAVKKDKLPSSESGKNCLTVEPPDSEQNDTEEDDIDSTFVPLISEKRKPIPKYEYKQFTKVKIDKDNLLQYFSEYTLSVSEYTDFLEELSNMPSFINSKIKCAKCVVTFLKKEDYLEHMKLHNSKTGDFSCTLCDLYFLDDQLYHTHITAHLTVRQCKICKQTCGLQHSLSAHIQTVHRHSLVYKCRVCAMFFETLSAMVKHNLLHKQLVCNECGKFQYNRNAMSRHIRIKHIPPNCPHCHVKLKGYKTLRTHLVNVHNYPSTKRKPIIQDSSKMENMYCVECDKQFTTMQSYKSHTSEVHRTVKRRYPCSECDKVLSKKTALNNHYNLYHGGGSKHRCDPCNKCFWKADGLRRHITHVHQKVPVPKNKECQTCGRCFHSKFTLINHMRTHTGERPYECSHCDARFAQQYARNAHVRKQHLKHLQPQIT